MASSEYLLSLDNVSKRFPGVIALDRVSFAVQRGDIHALVGENGAGKSTLIKILTGVHQADEGIVTFKGEEHRCHDPLDAMRKGISVVHQELNLAGNLDVCENIFLGKPIEKKWLGLKFIDWRRMYREAAELLGRLKIHIDPRTPAERLSVAQKQIVEIARAISFRCDLMIMDEPSATLTENELAVLFEILFRLKKEGVTVIYISHRLEEIFQLADVVTILRDGTHVKTCPVAEMDRAALVSAMVGRKLGEEYPKEHVPLGQELLRVEALENAKIRNIRFTLRRGEILGIAGLVGAGRTEVVRAIFGADAVARGTIYLSGKERSIKSVNDAIGNGIALVPEERKIQGLVLPMTVKENITMVGIDKACVGVFLKKKTEAAVTRTYVEKLKIVTPGIDQVVENLSGGNQQKVVLAKWLYADADILIFDEPTRGIDVGAKYEIYKLLTAMVREGKGVLMISSEMPELLGMCDRILVMHGGEIKGELKRSEFSQERIMHLATG